MKRSLLRILVALVIGVSWCSTALAQAKSEQTEEAGAERTQKQKDGQENKQQAEADDETEETEGGEKTTVVAAEEGTAPGKDGEKDKSQIQQQSAQDALASGRPVVSQTRNWTLSGGISTLIGQGTFVDPANDTEFADVVDDGSNAYDRVQLVYSFRPSYVWEEFVFTGSMSWRQWLTAGGGIDTNEPSQFRFSDISVDAFWFGYTLPSTKTNFSIDAGFRFPTSELSQAQSMIVDSFFFGIIRQPIFGRIFFVYGLGVGKTFHEFTSPVADIDEIGPNNAIFRPNGAEDVGGGLLAIGGVNTEYSLSNTVGLNFILMPRMQVQMRYSFTNFWTYDVDNEDEFTSEFAEPGRASAQFQSSRITLVYQAMPWLFLSGGISTAQPPKTSDNRSFRFPFWNFNGAANNFSSLVAGASIIY